jgi:uncharacterized membrane protein
METPIRSLAKAVTWQALGLLTMTAITYALTGSLATGGAVALLGAASGMITYVLHERLWARIRWGLAFAHDRAQDRLQDLAGRDGPRASPGA